MPVADVDRALTDPDLTARASQLIAMAEDQWFDRKSVRIKSEKLAETLSAMANADGGRVIVGLSNGEVEDLDAGSKHVSSLRQAGMDHLDPGLLVRCDTIDVEESAGERRQVLLLEVGPAADKVHRMKNGRVYLRIGDENRRLSPQQVVELDYDKGFGSFETTTVLGADLNDLDASSLAAYRRRIGAHQDPLEVLRDRTMATADEVTVAAVLLFWKNPDRYLPNAVLRVSRFSGSTRQTGRNQNLVDDVMLTGPIPRLVRKARDEIARLQPTRRALTERGQFADIPTVPEDAWLEGIVNALVHRSYSLQGDHVHVDIFDDRIEIFSPGPFPHVVAVDDPLSIRRYARNPRIVRVCYDLRICQELGEGIVRIFEEMRGAGLADPQYRQDAAGVTLTLSTRPVNEALDRRFPAGLREIISALRDRKRMSTAEIVDAVAQQGLSLSRPAIRARLNALRDQGIIDWYGKSPKDPRAYWYVPDEHSPSD